MPEREIGTISKARLETLADGVFAIVLTLLVLALLDPAPAKVSTPAELDLALLALWPKVVSYVISFVVAGIFWVAHHTQFHFIRHTNRRVIDRIYRRLSFDPICYSAALAVAFVRPIVSFFLYLATAAAYVAIQLTTSGLEAHRPGGSAR